MSKQTVDQYKKAFQKKKGETDATAVTRRDARIPILLKEGKLVK